MILDEDGNIEVRAVVGTYTFLVISYFKLRTIADARHDGPMTRKVIVQTIANMESIGVVYAFKRMRTTQTDIEVVLNALLLSDSRKTKQCSCA